MDFNLSSIIYNHPSELYCSSVHVDKSKHVERWQCEFYGVCPIRTLVYSTVSDGKIRENKSVKCNTNY